MKATTLPNRLSKMGPLAALCALLSCSSDALTTPEASNTRGEVEIARGVAAANGSVMVRTQSGLVSETRARALLDQVTGDVARALADPALRSLLHDELHASPYKEHKLPFRRFIENSGSTLLDRAAAAGGRSRQAILASLDSIVDLELYMPVPEHFARWTGGDDLIVVSALRDQQVPHGFDLQGRPAIGLTLASPPTVPTLVLIHRETNFGTVAALASARSGAGFGGGASTQAECNPEVSECGPGWWWRRRSGCAVSSPLEHQRL